MPTSVLIHRRQFAPLDYRVLDTRQLARLKRLPGSVFLDDLVVLSRRYMARLFNLHRYEEKAIHLAEEISRRLDQLNFLAKSIRYLTHLYFERAPYEKKVDRFTVEEQDHVRFVMYLYAASFYHLAFRAETILVGEKKLPGLPEVKGYKPVRGITIVRNTLLEHQFDHQPDLFGSERLIHGHYGPAFTLSGVSDRGYDKLYQQHKQVPVLVHAREFGERAERVLSMAFARLDIPDEPEEYIEDVSSATGNARGKRQAGKRAGRQPPAGSGR